MHPESPDDQWIHVQGLPERQSQEGDDHCGTDVISLDNFESEGSDSSSVFITTCVPMEEAEEGRVNNVEDIAISECDGSSIDDISNPVSDCGTVTHTTF